MVVVLAAMAMAVRTVDWSSPFAAALAGAIAGALAGGVGTAGITAFVAPRIAVAERMRERSESALAAVLASLEHDHWPLVNCYRAQQEAWAAAMAEGELVDAGSNGDAAADTAVEILESVRRLRLFASRVADPDFDAAFGAYFYQAFLFGVQTAARKQPNTIVLVVDPLAEALVEVLRVSNRCLGHTFWDPDLTKLAESTAEDAW